MLGVSKTDAARCSKCSTGPFFLGGGHPTPVAAKIVRSIGRHPHGDRETDRRVLIRYLNANGQADRGKAERKKLGTKRMVEIPSSPIGWD